MHQESPLASRPSGVEARWPGTLGGQFCPVSSYFLRNQYRLCGEKLGQPSLSSTQVIVIINILDFKWTGAEPFPSVTTIAKRMGVSSRAVREALRKLQDYGYVARNFRGGRSTKYSFDGLYAALERLRQEDISAAAQPEAA